MSGGESSWIWLAGPVLHAAHEEQLAEHGGGSGIRDLGLFESALARPRNLALYGAPDAAALAACYGYGLAKNHPFVDGNKRVAFIAIETFLDLNGFELAADDASCVMTMLGVAEGRIEEAELAAWIRDHLRALAG